MNEYLAVDSDESIYILFHFLKVSLGYGKETHGTQILDWQNVSSIKVTSHVDTGYDPLGLRSLEHFAGSVVYRYLSYGFEIGLKTGILHR